MDDNGQKNIMKNIFRGQLSWIIALIAVAVSVIMFIREPDTQMEKDIALIKNDMENMEKLTSNHLDHIKEDINSIEEENTKQSKKIEKLNQEITKLITILKEQKELE